jgi:hypothetical protein
MVVPPEEGILRRSASFGKDAPRPFAALYEITDPT